MSKQRVYLHNLEIDKVFVCESLTEACRKLGKTYNNYLRKQGFVDSHKKFFLRKETDLPIGNYKISTFDPKEEKLKSLDFFYRIEVSEGAPGFSDTDYFQSKMYGTFREAYSGLVNFDYNYWSHLRNVHRRFINFKGEKIFLHGNNIVDDDLKKLGITREEFKRIVKWAGIKKLDELVISSGITTFRFTS